MLHVFSPFRVLKPVILIAALVAGLPAVGSHRPAASRLVGKAAAVTIIQDVQTNLGDYPGGKVPRYEKLEITFRIALDDTELNRFDPDHLLVEGVFTTPEGQVFIQQAFFYQDYEYRHDSQSDLDVFTKKDSSTWKIRITPREVGAYQFFIRIYLRRYQAETTGPFTFESTDSDLRGFVRVSERNPRYFRFDNEEPFLGVGLNVGWWNDDQKGLSTYLEYLDRLQGYGINLIRIWMLNSGTNGDWILSIQDTKLGDTYNLQEAWALDYLLDEARRRGIYFILTLDDIHQFDKDKPAWQTANLYSASHGGPLEYPYEVFSDLDARKYQRQIFGYIVARWGYSPNILSWELFNEAYQLEGLADEMQQWHREMAQFIQGKDQASEHLVDTSTGSFADPGILELLYQDIPEIGLGQTHFYYLPHGLPPSPPSPSDPRGQDMANLTWYYARQLAETVTGKPLLVGEFGPVGADWTESLELPFDDAGVYVHTGLWASVMSGMAGAGLSWYWDEHFRQDDDWFRHYRALANYLKGMDPTNLQVMKPVNVEFPSDDPRPADFIVSGEDQGSLRAMGLRAGDSSLYVWIQNKEATWWNYVQPCEKDPQPVSGKVAVQGMKKDGYYQVEWWDPYQPDSTYQVVQRQLVVGNDDGEVVLEVQNLARDIAVKIVPATDLPILDIEKTVDKETADPYEPVMITTTVTNHGLIGAEVTFADSLSGCAPTNAIELGPEGGFHTYECVASSASDIHSSTVVTGQYSSTGFVYGGAQTYVPVHDGVVGSGSPGSCTEAALDADLFYSGGDTITFNCGDPERLSIPFSTTKVMQNNVTLDGGGRIALSGRNRVRVLTVESGVQLMLKGMEVGWGSARSCTTGNPAEGGGGIRNWGSLELQESKLVANRADYGGGLYSGSYGSTSILTSTVSGNQAGSSEGGGNGGGIYNQSVLHITGSTLSGNEAYGGGGLLNRKTGRATIKDSVIEKNNAAYGGGLENDSSGTLTLLRTKLRWNEAKYDGGGLVGYGDGRVEIFDSTVSVNHSEGNGGGFSQLGNGVVMLENTTVSENTAIALGGGLHITDGTVEVRFSTIATNQAASGGGVWFSENGNLQQGNSILARNQASLYRSQDDCAGPAGQVVSAGYNLVGIGDGCAWVDASGDLVGNAGEPQDPLLLARLLNGGPTANHALALNSPALDAGNPKACPAADQRGLSRLQGPSCDIGSYELAQVVAQDAAPVPEGNTGSGQAIFRVGIPGSAVQDITVSYTTEEGSAEAGSDFTPVSGLLTIQKGKSSQEVAVPVMADLLDEADENFFLNLVGVDYARIWDSYGETVVIDDDTALLTVGDAAVEEGREASVQAIFAVTLSTPAAIPVSVDFATRDGAAVGRSDYLPASGTLLFPPGETRQEISVTILPDSLDEPEETFFLDLNNPTGAGLTDGEGLGRILAGTITTGAETFYLPFVGR